MLKSNLKLKNINLKNNFLCVFKELDPNLVSKLNSYSTITDLNECLIQLLLNSIESGAKKILIKVNFTTFDLEIYDDGCSFDLDGLKLIGECYVSDKNLDFYTHHGSSIYNIIHLADRVDIIAGFDEKYLKTFSFKSYQSDFYETKIIKLDKNCTINYSTLIRVINLYCKYPIRQKYLKDNSNNLKHLLNNLEVLSLIHFQTEIVVLDFEVGLILFKTTRFKSIYEKFLNQFNLDKNNLKEFSIEVNRFYINGLIFVYSKSSSNIFLPFMFRKKSHFIYINKFYVSNSSYYEIILQELISCKEFNILNTESNQLIFCLNIISECNNFKIIKHKNKDFLHFKTQENENLFKESLMYFIRTFLDKFGYKKKNFEETKLIEFNRLVDKIDLDEENLKYCRVSKSIKAKNKPKLRIIKLKKINYIKNLNDKEMLVKLVRLNSTPVLDINKKKFLQNGSIYSKNKINYSKLRFKEKSTQTETPNIDLNQNLKNNFMTILNKKEVNLYNRVDLSFLEKQCLPIHKSFFDSKQIAFNFNFSCSALVEINFNKFKFQLQQNLLNKWKSKLNLCKLEQSLKYSELSKVDINTFNHLKVLSQIDQKYIATCSFAVENNIKCYSIYLFDQHACHERIRLESLLKDNFNNDNHSIIEQELIKPIYINIPFIFYNVFKPFQEKMKKFGFWIDAKNGKVFLYKVPKIFAKKISTNVDNSISRVNILIENELRKFLSGENSFQIPQDLMDMFNMEACRGAVKFGDKLTNEECCFIIENLSKCKLPFNCAHGRPTIAPIKKIYKNEKV